jgi:hypothetical protein
MLPDAANAQLQFTAMLGYFSRLAIPIGLLGPKQSHVLLIASGPAGWLGGSETAAQNQNHHPSHSVLQTS